MCSAPQRTMTCILCYHKEIFSGFYVGKEKLGIKSSIGDIRNQTQYKSRCSFFLATCTDLLSGSFHRLQDEVEPKENYISLTPLEFRCPFPTQWSVRANVKATKARSDMLRTVPILKLQRPTNSMLKGLSILIDCLGKDGFDFPPFSPPSSEIHAFHSWL